jgi:hypothetical protein
MYSKGHVVPVPPFIPAPSGQSETPVGFTEEMLETCRILKCSLAHPSEFVAHQGSVHPTGERSLWHVSGEKAFALNGTHPG